MNVRCVTSSPDERDGDARLEDGVRGPGVLVDVELGVGRDVARDADGPAHEDDLRDRFRDVGALVQRGGYVGQRADCDEGEFAGGT